MSAALISLRCTNDGAFYCAARCQVALSCLLLVRSYCFISRVTRPLSVKQGRKHCPGSMQKQEQLLKCWWLQESQLHSECVSSCREKLNWAQHVCIYALHKIQCVVALCWAEYLRGLQCNVSNGAHNGFVVCKSQSSTRGWSSSRGYALLTQPVSKQT